MDHVLVLTCTHRVASGAGVQTPYEVLFVGGRMGGSWSTSHEEAEMADISLISYETHGRHPLETGFGKVEGKLLLRSSFIQDILQDLTGSFVSREQGSERDDDVLD
ncbi:hypothetical protein FQN52_004657 [Onygenales sp. PD_12]|nr:hypothetical protein FQN52_004657 [Onygenales sp. PD_12]